MELYLIRHGQTDWNKAGKLQGTVDIPLNSFGREAAIKLGNELDYIKFDRIYASPLCRAFETACIIRGRKNVEIVRRPELTELDFGAGEGTVCSEWLEPSSPYNCFFTRPADYIPPEGGETFEHCMERTRSFVQNVLEQLPSDERVMIVAHGALNKGMMCYLEGNDKAHFWGDGLQDNCCATIFSYDGTSWKRNN